MITATGTSLLIAGGTFNFDGAEIDVSNITISGAHVDFSGADSVTIGNFLHAGGDVDFDHPLVRINGDFTRTAAGSTFDAGAGKVVFGGEKTQNLDISRPTEFYFVEVTEGTRLVETVEVDNASVSWFLWNRGVIDKTKPVPVSGTVSFGLTGVELEVNDPGTFTTLQVERVGGNHQARGALALHTDGRCIRRGSYGRPLLSARGRCPALPIHRCGLGLRRRFGLPHRDHATWSNAAHHLGAGTHRSTHAPDRLRMRQPLGLVILRG
jgi:hypothetical protein